MLAEIYSQENLRNVHAELQDKRNKVEELNRKVKLLKAELSHKQDENENCEVEAQKIKRRSRSDSIKMEEMEISVNSRTEVEILQKKLTDRKVKMEEISALTEALKVSFILNICLLF